MHKNIKTKRPVRFSDDGLTVFVTLTSGKAAMIDRDDYERFLSEGLSLNWYTTTDRFGNNYVNVYDKHLRNIVTVARRIMRAGRGEVISYYNGNRFDLRKANLRRGEGRAWRKPVAPVNLGGVTLDPAPKAVEAILRTTVGHFDHKTRDMLSRLFVAVIDAARQSTPQSTTLADSDT
ncbi:hypothetical protein [uncultured Agrobacterium sp.]|uniref:hypothetical protein n=1 Tax=uncultured Agrobacterium sp. TaxID=157277 RepID=UPI0025CBF1C3|nr:hypothetical protein [uncultured Agrobacterium sp.]